MPLNVIVAGGEYSISSASVITASAPATISKTIRRVERYDSSAWKVVKSFAPSFSLSITPDVTVATDVYPSPITSDPVIAYVSGGTGPFTYVWTQLSGPSVTILTPTVASTRFRGSPPEADFFECQFMCTATDSIGQVATATCNVTLTR